MQKVESKADGDSNAYERLFSPIEINGMKLENRIVMAPAHEGMFEPDGSVGPEYRDFYFRRAQGGPGMIVLGGVLVNPRRFPAPRLNDDRFVSGYRELVDRVHSETETKITVQLYDLLKAAKGWRQPVEEVPIAQIKDSVDFFESAAVRAREAGFDAIEIHAAHGVLQADFLSLRNKREDEYGGKKLENRLRFTAEVYERVRKALGDDYPIGIRINGDEFTIGGTTLAQSRVTAVKLCEMGLNYISISVGGKYDDSVGDDPWGLRFPYPPWGGYSGFRCMPENYMPDATNVYLAEGIRKAVRDAGHNQPIMTAGKIPNPELAESILQEGKADLIGICRQMIRDADWAKKAREGRAKEIERCIYCNECLKGATIGPSGHCRFSEEHKAKQPTEPVSG